MKNDAWFTVTLFLVAIVVLFTVSYGGFYPSGTAGVLLGLVFVVTLAVFGVVEGLTFKTWGATLPRFGLLIAAVLLAPIPAKGIDPVMLVPLVVFCLVPFGLGIAVRALLQRRYGKVPQLAGPLPGLVTILSVPVLATVADICFVLFAPASSRYPGASLDAMILANMSANRRAMMLATLHYWTAVAWVVAIVWLLWRYTRRQGRI